MNTKIISLNDKYRGLKESIQVTNGRQPRGEVGIYEKTKCGKLRPLVDKSNMIVFSGREWLLRKAFGSSLVGSESQIYNKVIRWFGVGNGGGEPGNPLQAGATYGQDTALCEPVRLRSDLVVADPGYVNYASDYQGNFGYYKKFSSVTIKEDRGNPYSIGNITNYPSLIAEVRIELSSDDANGGGTYEDLNEAALFVADPESADPGADYATTGQEIGTSNLIQVSTDGDYAVYYFNTYDLATDIPNLNVGDYLWVNTGDHNDISSVSPSIIIDIYNGEASVRKAYVVVEKPGAVDTSYTPTYPVGHFVNKTITPYIMFSRVTFSTLRKTTDREIVFLWRIYF
jgi:hypothetical protein